MTEKITSCQKQRHSFFFRNKLQKLFFFSWILGIALFAGSCDYVARFIIRIDEGSSYPCVGVSHISFVVQSVQESQDEIIRHKQTTSFLPSDLFWNVDTGKCQIEGIPIKEIPYGGERIITLKAYDSLGTLLVSGGSSERFLVEASGGEVKDQITMSLKRKKGMSLGSLIVRFDDPIPIKTTVIHITLSSYEDPIKKISLNKEIRPIPVDSPPPKFIILTNIPAAKERGLTFTARDNQNKILAKSRPASYNITNKTPKDFYFRVAVRFQAN